MSSFEQRRAALDFAMRHVGDTADLQTIFTTADKFDAYLKGQRPNGLLTWDTTLVSDLVACYEDPLVFLRRYPYQHPIKGAVTLQPYPFQEDAVRLIHENRFTHINTARQMGMTTAISSYILWLATSKPDQTILIMNYRFYGAAEVLERIRYAHANLPEHLKLKVTTDIKREMCFENGSQIIVGAVSSMIGKGRAVSAVFLDDFAHVSHSVAEQFWTDYMPVFASGMQTKVCMYGCPSDDRGMFHTVAQNMPDNGFVGMTIPWHLHPDRDEAWAKPFRDTLSERQFRREFQCEYIAADKR